MSDVAVLTGVNRGIGLELTKQLISRNWQVFALCRQSSEALDASGATVITGVEVTDQSALRSAKTQIGDVPIQLLVNNAGVLMNEDLGNMDDTAFGQIETQLQINAIAPLKVTSVFLDQIQNGGKIANITSRMGSIDDNSSGGRYGYRMSKAALNMASKSMAIDLSDRDIAVGIFHPGWVQTEMTGFSGQQTPEQTAAMLMDRIDALSMDTTGQFFHANGEPLPW